MNYKYAAYALIMLSTFTSGCSLFSPIKEPHVDTYILNTAAKDVHHCNNKHHSIIVSPVTAEPMYNKTDMVYSQKPYEVAHFAKNKWVETPAQMLQPLIVKTLQNSHCFNTISALSATVQHDRVLNVHLIELQQIFCSDSSQVHLELRAELINTSNNQIIASKTISVTEPVLERSPYGGVIAANQATVEALRILTNFCVGLS